MTESQELQETEVANDIGTLLSQERLKRNESLTEVSAKTRLTEAVIDKMENNQFAEISTPVYVRGYLTQYAKYLGLDSDAIVAQYNATHPTEIPVIRPSAMGYTPPRKQTKRHSKTLSAFVVLVVGMGLYYFYMRSESLILKQQDSNSTETEIVIEDPQAPVLDENVSNVLDEVTQAENLANDALNGNPVKVDEEDDDEIPAIELLSGDSDTVTNKTLGDALKEIQSPADSLKLESLAANETGTGKPRYYLIEEGKTDSNNINNKTAEADTETAKNTNTPAEDPNRAASRRVRMTFKQESWVKIVDGTGKTLTGRIYKKGQTVDVIGKPPFDMTVGSPESLQAMTVDGKTVNLSTYQVKGIRYRVDK